MCELTSPFGLLSRELTHPLVTQWTIDTMGSEFGICELLSKTRRFESCAHLVGSVAHAMFVTQDRDWRACVTSTFGGQRKSAATAEFPIMIAMVVIKR